MVLVDVSEEYMDALLQEFAYDPVQLPHEEDPTQLLYNHGKVETIWVTNHVVNPYTLHPFHIKNDIPHTDLRHEMQRYTTVNRTLGLQVFSIILNSLTQEKWYLFWRI